MVVQQFILVVCTCFVLRHYLPDIDNLIFCKQMGLQKVQ